MGLWDWFKKRQKAKDPFAELYSRQPRAMDPMRPQSGDEPQKPKRKGSKGGATRTLADLAAMLEMEPAALKAFKPSYHTFNVPKRNGKMRRICAPDAATKHLQRLLLRRVFARLRAHPAAHGFEKGRSIVSNAAEHTDAAVVIKMDIKNYFEETLDSRVEEYFRAIGWDKAAVRVLMALTTHEQGLPQGAPTSPRLSNLVNYRLDMSLDALAKKLGMTYTRYADDMTFSSSADDRAKIASLLGHVENILLDFEYDVHWRKTLCLRRWHQRQTVTGLVVNDGVGLPRETRRWLRAVEHRLRTGREASLTPTQLQGWRAFEAMVDGWEGPVG